MGAAAAWAIPAVISVIGGVMSKHQSDKAMSEQRKLGKQQTDIFNEIKPNAQNYLNQSQQAIGPALSYYTSMLSNPRESTAPEQNRISSLYAGQAANARRQAPRGGYSLGAAERVRSQHSAAQEDVIQRGRPMAASALGGLGTNLGSLGFQGYGMGAGILGNVFQQGLAARNQGFQQGSVVGNGLYNAYQSYLLGRSLDTGGGGNQTLPTSSGQGLYPPGYQPGNFTPGASGNSGSSNLYSGNLPNSGFSGDEW